MNQKPREPEEAEPGDFLSGGGEMGALMRALDWSKTPVGPPSDWPQSLRTAVGILLSSRHPMFLWWGPELVQFYNDGYRPILGTTKHPAAMGQRGRECWKEIWEIIGPMLETVFAGGSTYVQDGLLCLYRHGFLEESYFNYAYSPIRDEVGNVAGVFVACSESTRQVIGERRLKLLSDLRGKASEATDPAEACETAARILSAAGPDLPFALIYLLDPTGRAELAGSAGMSAADDGADPSGWPIEEAITTGRPVLVEALASRFGKLPGGPWPESPRRALVLPLVRQGSGRASGAVVVGLSPRLALDDQYRNFLELVVGHITTAINNARARREERRRAEALAELDRAKTAFFSNVSHEFRTPLTLMLGPIEEALADTDDPLPPAQRERIAPLRRNSLRLLKLVNTLLDFSRIEAGRAEASYEPTDLARLTADLASVFRSAIEKAGIRFVIDCPPLPQPVYVDREMWEKIVFNLLSNAFKFTFKGEIAVALHWKEDHVELQLRDTGTGISEEDLPHLFKRFHRIKGARARTHEGSGIGLALVQELVRLHGGRIEAESRVDHGTTFTLSIPAGSSHLPPDRVGAARSGASAPLGAAPYLDEMIRWLPVEFPDPGPALLPAPSPVPALANNRSAAPPQTQGARLLLADDNADMRDYVGRLLSPRWKVEAVSDGTAALAAARERPPDLILSDVMMPGLDGFQLLRSLRADPKTREIPVILLSARIGGESRVEGLEAGADDYLVKPFFARELIARVAAHLELARVRRERDQALRESEWRFRTMADTLPALIWMSGTDKLFTYFNKGWLAFTGRTMAQELGNGWAAGVHPDDLARCLDTYVTAFDARRPFEMEYRLRRADGEDRWLLDLGTPWFHPDGGFAGYIGSCIDISDRREIEEVLRRKTEEAEEASRLKSQFVSNVSHDLRTPLSAILGYTHLLLAEMYGPVGDEQKSPLSGVQRNAENLLKMINDVLDLAKIESGKTFLEIAPVDLSSLIREIVAEIRPLSEKRSLFIRCEIDEGLPVIESDARKIQQILMNLLSNAIKFTEAGGVTIRLKDRPEAGGIEAAVQDTGIGIPLEDLPRIFEAFYQGEGKSKSAGTGLGLAIVRDLAGLLEGTIDVESELGKGTTFTFFLPCRLDQKRDRK